MPKVANLADGIVSVEVGDVRQRFASTFHANVNVEIRQRYALRIQQTLEQEVVLKRIKFRDAEAESDQ